jgi:ribonuclease HII
MTNQSDLARKLLKFDIETSLKDDSFIIGCDEVGRGCLAGPIVGGAVNWNTEFITKIAQDLQNLYPNLTNLDKKMLIKEIGKGIKKNPHLNDLYLTLQIDDSKKLTQKKRELLAEFIKANTIWNIHEISAEEIDKYGIGQANKKVLEESSLKTAQGSSNIRVSVLVDHFKIFTSHPNIKIFAMDKGDEKSLSIAAASIIAKVYRDKLMKEHHEVHPQYGFNTNVGYGSAAHMAAIKTHGLSPLHRRSFTKALV